MVAKITMPHSIMDALNYNERKLQQGKAVCIAASGYLLPPEKMNFYQKLAGFENLNKRNDRAATKTLHVSLNFDPSEKLSTEQLNTIAETYMQKIGFGGQPYLVYRHDDAGHPHVHIVSTTIKEDGSRINTHNIGRNQSEKARKEIEAEYNLARAEEKRRHPLNEIKPVDVEKVQYGKSETKKSIVNVLNAVVDKYNYTSLPEFNAILRQFNVLADRGAEDGVMFAKKGLLYRIINNDGVPTGVPVKASSIYNKPTLQKLEENFELNQANRGALKQKLKAVIDDALLAQPSSIAHLKEILAKRQVFTLVRQNAEGRMYGITFVDNKNRSVFNGSEIGKAYSIGHLQTNVLQAKKQQDTPTPAPEKISTESIAHDGPAKKQKQLLPNRDAKNNSLLEQLMAPQQQFESVPFQLLKKKKKKRKKKSNEL